jgi:hypothetical protein
MKWNSHKIKVVSRNSLLSSWVLLYIHSKIYRRWLRLKYAHDLLPVIFIIKILYKLINGYISCNLNIYFFFFLQKEVKIIFTSTLLYKVCTIVVGETLLVCYIYFYEKWFLHISCTSFFKIDYWICRIHSREISQNLPKFSLVLKLPS